QLGQRLLGQRLASDIRAFPDFPGSVILIEELAWTIRKEFQFQIVLSPLPSEEQLTVWTRARIRYRQCVLKRFTKPIPGLPGRQRHPRRYEIVCCELVEIIDQLPHAAFD